MRNASTDGAATNLELAESGNIAELVRKMLRQLGEDPEREGLRRTPERLRRRCDS